MSKLFHSIKAAINGLGYVLAREQNFRLQLAVAVICLVAAWLFNFSLTEWSVLILLIGFVLVLELMNSAVEKILDILKPRLHDQVGLVKDIAAGAVLVGSVSVLFVGIIFFGPHIIALLSSM